MERAVVTNNFGFEFLFSVVLNRMPRPLRHFHADADPKTARRTVLELHRFQIFMNGVGNLADNERLGVFNLLLSPESLMVSTVSAVRTMAWCRTFYPSSRRNLEIS